MLIIFLLRYKKYLENVEKCRASNARPCGKATVIIQLEYVKNH